MNEYLCLGGPLDMKTHATGGEPNFYVQAMDAPKLKASEITYANDAFGPSFNMVTHIYNRNDISIFGVIRKVYVHADLSDKEASNRIGLFFSSLLDLYVKS